MQLKDYYSILETDPSATPDDIKKSFRRLAHQFHPDKNPGIAEMAARFVEIQEAYEVLIDPASREEYNYKRWHIRSLGKAYAATVVTPADVVRELTRLSDYVQSMNIFHIDNEALSIHIRTLLNDANTSLLLQSKEPALKISAVEKILIASHPLSWKYMDVINKRLRLLSAGDTSTGKRIAMFLGNKRRAYIWDKYKFTAVAALTLLLCALIYFVSR